MEIPAKVKELGIEKIIFGPAALMAQGVPVEVKLSYGVLQERTAYVLNAIAVHDDLLAALEEMEDQLDQLNTETLTNLGLDGARERIQNAIAKARGGE